MTITQEPPTTTAGGPTEATPGNPYAAPADPFAEIPHRPLPPAPPGAGASPDRREPLPPMPVWAAAVRNALVVIAILILGVFGDLAGFGRLSHDAQQRYAFDALRQQLAEGTAPVSELNLDGKKIADGTPVALLSIPAIGMENEAILEGTSAGVLMGGPGHRRDTVLPGQTGSSVVMGRKAAFGGPFSRLEELAPGDTLTVITGQGEHTYRVIGTRYAGDPSPAPPASDEARLVLMTARGPGYMPHGIVRVDAQLISQIYPAGQRVTTAAALPEADEPMKIDTRTVWALVLWLEALLAVALGVTWAYYRWGHWQAWIVGIPVGAAVFFQIADQACLLLPNLL